MRRVYSIALLLLVALGLSATTKEVKLKLVETSDIHGNFFPYNFIEQREGGEEVWHGYIRSCKKNAGRMAITFCYWIMAISCKDNLRRIITISWIRSLRI